MSLELLLGASVRPGDWLSSVVADETFPGAKQGLCRGMGGLFYPAGESTDSDRNDGPIYDSPKAICAQCPVTDACREYALTAREQWGVWGGTTPRERRAMWRTGGQGRSNSIPERRGDGMA